MLQTINRENIVHKTGIQILNSDACFMCINVHKGVSEILTRSGAVLYFRFNFAIKSPREVEADS